MVGAPGIPGIQNKSKMSANFLNLIYSSQKKDKNIKLDNFQKNINCRKKLFCITLIDFLGTTLYSVDDRKVMRRGGKESRKGGRVKLSEFWSHTLLLV